MGKASDRRRRHRQAYLQNLAETDPAQFSLEWSKRVESWAGEIERNAGRLADTKCGRMPGVFKTVDYALEELSAIGGAAQALEGDATREVLDAECCKAISRTVDTRMYRLSNIRQNLKTAEAGWRV